MINKQIAEKFEEIADMLEILDESIFRIRAYRRASDVLLGLSQDLADLAENEDDAIEKIPGIGKDLHAKILEFIADGEIQMHKDLVKKLSPGILDILKVRSVGPKKAKLFYEELEVDNIDKLRAALESGAIVALPGMGEKSSQGILTALDQATHLQERIPIFQVLPVADAYIEYMKECKAVVKVQYAGSLRRRMETIGDVDILATGTDPEAMSEHFRSYGKVKQILAAGETKSSVVLNDNIQVDFRVVKPESFGAALYYFTGSKHHNIQVRTLALKKHLKINEYGLFDGEKMIAGATEEEFFHKLGMDYIPPELREDQGEIEAAKEKNLPKLIEGKDLRGDLHSHSKWSDGAYTVYEMAKAADELGREYLAITDHMSDPKVIKEQWKEIDKTQAKLKKEGYKIKLLKGAEVDILKTGDLNLPDEILEKLEIVLISVHTSFDLPKKEQTERVLKAMASPHVNVLSHPTGRLLGERDAIEIDMDKIIKAAKKLKIALEIDSQPLRMDLNGAHARLCKEQGVKVTIDSDAHMIEQLKQTHFGIFMARRGWLEKKDVLNTLPYSKLMKFLSK